MSKNKIRIVSDRISNPGLRARIKAVLKSLPWLSTAIFSGELLLFGYLAQSGWVRSAGLHLSVDREGNPIPWFTYPAIEFLQRRVEPLLAERHIFEYGSGNSTLWWSRRCRSVVSCEHDLEWSNYLRPQMPSNVEVLFRPRGPGYHQGVSDTGKRFDVVVCDGIERNLCALHLSQSLETVLSDDGIIIWDNSDRDRYKEGMDLLRNAGFREVEFYGLSPIARAASGTTIFYRSNNFLGL